MKGVIPKALKQMLLAHHGIEVWSQVLSTSGISREPLMLPISDVDDGVVLALVEGTCKVLGISLTQAADAFGTYWVNEFAPSMYKHYFAGRGSAKEFLLEMNAVHDATTRAMKNAKPPKFVYEEQSDGSILMEYHSTRGLMDIFIGLVKGVGIYFGETLDLKRVGTNGLRISFR